MNLRFQFGAVPAAMLMAALFCAPALAQRPRLIAQKATQQQREQPQSQPQQQAQPDRPNARRAASADNLPAKVFRRLRDMPPGRQQQFLRNSRRFQNLPPERQAQIRQRLKAWNRLTPEQQQNLRERQRIWEHLTPQQQVYVRKTLLPRWRQLPPPRRKAILQRLHSLRKMNESDRRAKLNDPAFVEGLNQQDRETLSQLAHLHVGMAPDAPGM
jgi:Protein of unknown function (DUF3106)